MPQNAEMQRVAREGALLAGGARAILLQVAHPAVGRGVAEHSDFATRPLDRLRTTLTYVYCVTFGPLDSAVANKVYDQYAMLGTALQVPAGSWPANRAEFGAYWQQMVDTLEVSDGARRVARDLLDPKHAPLLLKAAMPANRFLTTAWLPEPIRRQYGLRWGHGQQRMYDALMTVSRPVYRLLPLTVREAPKSYYLRDMRRRLAA
jgi:uncharacterized protein (DUF2236 family)